MARASQSSRLLVTAVALTASVACAACTEDPFSVSPNDYLREILTSEVAQNLDRNGRFVLDSTPAPGEIGSDLAKEYALAFWQSYGSAFFEIIQSDRGSPVHKESLTVCSRAYYLASAYSDVSANTPLNLRKIVGSHWLVGLCYGEMQEVVMAVSANATDVRLATAQAPFDKGYGNFMLMGVPVGVQVPLLPEAAALFVAAQTGTRVSALPRLIARAYPGGPFAAVWHVDLESPVESTGTVSGLVRELRTLSTGHLNGWGRALLVSGQPETSLVDEWTFPTPDHSTVTYAFLRRADVPREFEEVAIRRK